jgi:hypothetical protein
MLLRIAVGNTLPAISPLRLAPNGLLGGQSREVALHPVYKTTGDEEVLRCGGDAC